MRQERKATRPAGAGACRKADFAGEPNHINGVFAADIMGSDGILRRPSNSREKGRDLRCLAGVFA
jgi:hypothetical protein